MREREWPSATRARAPSRFVCGAGPHLHLHLENRERMEIGHGRRERGVESALLLLGPPLKPVRGRPQSTQSQPPSPGAHSNCCRQLNCMRRSPAEGGGPRAPPGSSEPPRFFFFSFSLYFVWLMEASQTKQLQRQLQQLPTTNQQLPTTLSLGSPPVESERNLLAESPAGALAARPARAASR